MTNVSNEVPSDFSPRQVFEAAIRKWKWVVIWVLAGALTGWMIASLRPAVYEARAVFSFNIDYTLSGVLTDVEEDQALEAAGDLLRSTGVKEAALSQASAAGFDLTPAELQESVFIERRNSAWLVIVRRPNAAEAAQIANLWGEAFTEVYQQAYGHALKADGLQRYLNSLESCLRETASVEPAQAGCRLDDLAAVQAELASTGDEIRRERLAGKNIFAGMLFEWSEKAETPAAPVFSDRNKFLLLGALAGLIGSLWFIETWPGRRKAS